MSTINQAGGQNPDLLSAIYNVQVRHEEKITEADRLFCENEQTKLYSTLDQLTCWYTIFRTETERYKENPGITCEVNGMIKKKREYKPHSDETDYTECQYEPFDDLKKIVELYYRAVNKFAHSIVRHFNDKYNISAEYPDIDEETLSWGFRPEYRTYVDSVIEHLGGKGFRKTAEDELIKRFHDVVIYSQELRPELKGDKITFPRGISYDNFYPQRNKLDYEGRCKLSNFCAGIAFGGIDSLECGREMILDFDDENIDVSVWYDLATSNPTQMKFFRNRRVDVKFEDREKAAECFRKLRLDTIIQNDDED